MNKQLNIRYEKIIFFGIIIAFQYFAVSLVANSTHEINSSVYHSARSGYSIETPEGWVKIPDNVLSEVAGEIFNTNSAGKGVTEYAFQPDSSDNWFQFPFVIVNVLNYSDLGIHRQIYESEFDKIVTTMTNVKSEKFKRKMKETIKPEYQEDFSEYFDSEVYLEKGKRRFKWITKTNRFDGSKGIIQMTGFFGKQSIVLIVIYSDEEDWHEIQEDYKNIIELFKFDLSMSYDNTLAEYSIGIWILAVLESKYFQGFIGFTVGAAILKSISNSRQKSDET